MEAQPFSGDLDNTRKASLRQLSPHQESYSNATNKTSDDFFDLRSEQCSSQSIYDEDGKIKLDSKDSASEANVPTVIVTNESYLFRLKLSDLAQKTADSEQLLFSMTATLPAVLVSSCIGAKAGSRWKVVHQPIPSPYHPTCFGPVIHSVHIEPAEAEGCETQTSQPLLLVGYNWRLQTIQYRVFQPIGILVDDNQALPSDSPKSLDQSLHQFKMPLKVGDANQDHPVFFMTVEMPETPWQPSLSSGLPSSYSCRSPSGHNHISTEPKQAYAFPSVYGAYALDPKTVPAQFYRLAMAQILAQEGPLTLQMLCTRLTMTYPFLKKLGSRLPITLRVHLATNNDTFRRSTPPDYLPYKGKEGFWECCLPANAIGDPKSILLRLSSVSQSPKPLFEKQSNPNAFSWSAFTLPSDMDGMESPIDEFTESRKRREPAIDSDCEQMSDCRLSKNVWWSLQGGTTTTAYEKRVDDALMKPKTNVTKAIRKRGRPRRRLN